MSHWFSKENSCQHLEAIVDKTSMFIFIVDSNFRIVFVNQSFLDQSGFTENEVLKKSIKGFLLDPTLLKEKKHVIDLVHCVDTCENQTGLCAFRQKNSSDPLFVKVSIARDTVRDSLCIITAYDIREQLQVEEQLRESKHRFEQSFENAPIGMALVSPEGNWIRVNHRLSDILGYTKEDFRQLRFQDITHPDDLQIDLEFVKQMLLGTIVNYTTEKRYLKKDNTYIWTRLSVSLVHDDAGEPLYFISQIQDISEFKRYDEDLQERMKKIERMNQMMIGRELKMVELKNRIQELEMELAHGEYDDYAEDHGLIDSQSAASDMSQIDAASPVHSAETPTNVTYW